MKNKFYTLLLCSLCGYGVVSANDAVVNVNMNTKHTVGNVSTFNRDKFITIHAELTGSDWDGTSISDLRKDLLSNHNVHLGRSTSSSWYLNNMVEEDPNNPGFASEASVKSLGTNAKSNYANKSSVYEKYEDNSNIVFNDHFYPFWPDGTKTNKGWSFSTKNTTDEPLGTATGNFDAMYLKYFFGNGGKTGPKKPLWFEAINEPYWGGGTTPESKYLTMDSLAIYHNSVAKQVKMLNPEMKVGGYTIAFPDVDKNNFSQWEEREKHFFDLTHENLDFWSIHLYDSQSSNGKKTFRQGARMEAILDLMEQYSFIKSGKVQPFLVSEYGGKEGDLKTWSSYRDWVHMKSVNAMRMQFMDKPNVIEKTVEFLLLKATWTAPVDSKTYMWRLLRKENEPSSYSGDWVYTDMIKNFKLWSDVNGTRVDAVSNNCDIKVDSYVDGNNLFVIMHNYDLSKTISIKPILSGNQKKPIKVNVRKLYLSDNKTTYIDEDLTDIPEFFELKPEATTILKYSYSDNITINNNSKEIKYYANEYMQPIDKTVAVFNINNVVKGEKGEAILRLGIGRTDKSDIYPNIMFNDSILEIDKNYLGDETQGDMSDFFGVYSIKVPYDKLLKNNVIKVVFKDKSGGGYISSASMRVFTFDNEVVRGVDTNSALPLNNIKNIKVYFNKDNKKLILDTNNLKNIISLKIYSSNGNKVYNKDSFSSDEVNLCNLNSGVYLIRILTKKGYINKKILI